MGAQVPGREPFPAPQAVVSLCNLIPPVCGRVGVGETPWDILCLSVFNGAHYFILLMIVLE